MESPWLCRLWMGNRESQWRPEPTGYYIILTHTGAWSFSSKYLPGSISLSLLRSRMSSICVTLLGPASGLPHTHGVLENNATSDTSPWASIIFTLLPSHRREEQSQQARVTFALREQPRLLRWLWQKWMVMRKMCLLLQTGWIALNILFFLLWNLNIYDKKKNKSLLLRWDPIYKTGFQSESPVSGSSETDKNSLPIAVRFHYGPAHVKPP